jgi:hypothetical protein
MKTIIREMRGIPFFLLKEYLEEMGGKEIREDVIQGAGWTVHLERMEPFRIGSLSIGQSKLTIEIAEEVEEDFIKRFSMKTLRAGG